jgi:ABC-type Zn uptake system ZnuABC Zn-binding protein ZnuA
MINDVQKVFQRMVDEHPYLEDFMFTTTSPAYRYFSHRGNNDRYFWTTETVRHNGKPRYASGIYRYLKTKNQYKLTHEAYHAKRKDAKARALKLWEYDKA